MTTKDRFDYLVQTYGHLMQISMVAYQEAVTHWYNMEVDLGSLTVDDLMEDTEWLCDQLSSEMEKRNGLPEEVEGDNHETEVKTSGTETEGSA